MNKIFDIFQSSRLALAGLLIVLAVGGFAVTYALTNKNTYVSPVDCQGTCVALKADKAYPDTITITPGSYVQFNSADGKSHSLSLGGGGDEHEHQGTFYSGEFKSDEAWRVQFKDEGSFQFHDHNNPDINVLVVVYTPGKDYKVE